MAVNEGLALQKEQSLKKLLQGLGSVAVGFSSGVDSTYLLAVAHEVLGEKAVGVTIRSCFVPGRELAEAEAFCSRRGIRHLFVEANPLEIDGVAQNPPDRCYHCKKKLFTLVRQAAAENGLAAVAEGSNMDDLGDYRPGLRAVAELRVESPLRAAGLYKEEIRYLSRLRGLPTAAKPSFACLASRFVYGETITEAGLQRVDQAEQLLQGLGFSQFRVRVHGNLARIEVAPQELERLLAHREAVAQNLKEYGFAYVAMDLLGYRTGSMNETILKEGVVQ